MAVRTHRLTQASGAPRRVVPRSAPAPSLSEAELVRLLERLRAQRRAPDVLERIIAGWLRESGAGAHDIAVIGRAAGLWQGPPSPTGVARLERMARPVAPWSGATTLVAPRPALARDESWFAALRLAAVDVSLPSGFVPQPTRPAEATPLAPRAPGVYLALADGAGEAAQLVDTARARTLLGGGAPLEARLARRLRPILAAQGHALDLTTIRIHTGPAADALARELGARAFALGPDLVFADGMFAPERGDGLARLVHELTHTWQQAIGRAEPGRVAALEAEARHAASHLDADRDGPAEAPAEPRVAALKAPRPSAPAPLLRDGEAPVTFTREGLRIGSAGFNLVVSRPASGSYAAPTTVGDARLVDDVAVVPPESLRRVLAAAAHADDLGAVLAALGSRGAPDDPATREVRLRLYWGDDYVGLVASTPALGLELSLSTGAFRAAIERNLARLGALGERILAIVRDPVAGFRGGSWLERSGITVAAGGLMVLALRRPGLVQRLELPLPERLAAVLDALGRGATPLQVLDLLVPEVARIEVGGATLTLGAHDDPTADWIPDGETWTLPRLPPWVSDRVGTPSGGQAQLAHRGNDRGLEVRARVTWEGGRSAELALNVQRVLTAVREQLPPEARAGLDTVLAELGLDVASGAQPTPGPAQGPAPGDAHQAGPVAPSAKEGGAAPAGRALHAELAAGILHVSVSGEPGIDAHWDLHQLFEEGDASALVPIDFALTGPGLRLAWDGTGLAASAAPPATARALVERDVEASELVRRVLRVPARELVHVAVVVDGEGEAQRAGVHVRHPNTGPATAQIYAEVAFRAAARALAERASQTTSLAITLGVDAALSERLDGLGVVAEVAGADAGRGGDGRPLRLELGYTAAHLVEAAFGRPAALLEPDHRRVDVMGFVSAGLEADGGEAPASWDGMARLGASSEALPAAALAPARRLFQLAGDGPLSLTMTAYFGGGGLGLRLGPAPSAGQRPQALRVKVDAARLGSELEALLAGMGPLGESLLARLGLREGWVQTLAASFDSHGVLRFAPRGGGSDGRGFALDLHGEVQSLLQLFEVGTGDVGAWLRTLLPSFDLALPDLPRVTLANGLPSWLESWYERPAPRLRLDALPERIRALADRLGVDDLVPIFRVNRTATGVLQVAFGVQLGGRSLVFSGDFGAPLERMWSRIQGARAVAERVAQSLRELRRDGGARPAATTPAAATPTSPAGATPEPATRVAPSAKATRDDAAKDLGATVAALTENLDVSMDEGGVARLSVGPNGSILKVGFDLTRVMEGLALADLEPVELEIGALGLQVQTRAGPEPLPAGAVEVARPSEAELMFSGVPPAVTIPELVRQHLRIEATRASVQAFRSAVPGGDTSAAHDALGLYFQVPVMTSSQSPPADSAARLLLDLAPLLPRMQARIPQWLSSRVAATGWSIGLTTERRENTVTLELRRAASAPGANDDLLLRLGYTPQHAVDALSDATVLLVPDHVVAVRGMPDAAHPLADFHPMLDGIPAAGFPDAQQAWVAIGERGGVLRFVDYAAAADGSTVFAATTAGRPLFDLPVAMLWRLLLRVVSFVAPERAAQLGSAGAWLYRNGLLRIPVGVGRFLDFEPAPLFRALRSGDVTSLRPSGFHLGGDGLQVRLAERRPGDPPLEHFAERLVDADLGDIPSEVRELLGIPASVAGTKVVISGDPAVRQLAVAIIPPEPPQNANPPLPPRREIFVRLDLEVLKRRVMSLWQTLSGITGAVGSAAARIRAWLANLTWDRGGGERPARGAASGGSWSWLLGKLRIRFPRLWDGPEVEQDQEEESTEISFDFLGALARLLRSGAAFLASLVPDSFRFPSPFGRIRWRLSDLLPRRPRSVRPPAERGRRWRLPAVGAWLRGLIDRLDLDLHLPSLGDGPDRPRLPRPRLPDVELPDLETYCEIETRWDEASHTAGMTAYVRLLGGQEHALDFDFRVPRILERLRRLGGGARDLVRRLLDKLRRRPGPNEPPEAAGRRAGGVTGTLTEDGILILREAWFEPPQTRPMRIGFDLKRLLDGVDALDLVPYELDMPGDHVDIALGAATRPDGMPAAAARDRRPLAVAPPPGGAGFTLAAPADLRTAVGAPAGARVRVVLALERIAPPASSDASPPAAAPAPAGPSNDLRASRLVLYAQCPAEGNGRALRADIRLGDRLTRVIEGIQRVVRMAAQLAEGAGLQVRLDREASASLQGLVIGLEAPAFTARVGWRATTLLRLATGAISAGSGPTLLGTLEDPDFTDLLLTQSGVRVSVSHPAGTRSDANQRLGDRPSWATRERRVQVPVPAWLAELAHLQRPAESARAPARGVPTDATAADPDASVAGAARQVHANLYANAGELGVELFLGFAAARSEDEATGVLVTLPAALIERMRQRVAAIAGRVRAAARALRPTRGAEPPAERAPSSSAVRIAALVSGVRLTAAVDGRDSYIEYGWPTVLELLQGHHDLATLMPDRFDLHTRALELQYLPEPEIQAARDAAGAAAEATAREARARQITDASTRGMLVRDLPALLRDALAALDLQPLDRVRLPDESEAGSTRVDAQTGMCSITLRVWRASQPTRLWTLSFGMSLEGLVQLVLPRRLSQRMGQRDARNLIGFRPNPQDHRLEVFYRRLRPDRRLHFEVRAGWTLAEIFDVLSHLAEVAEHPARAMPSSFTGAYEAADIRLSLHYDERAPASPPGDGDHAVDFRAMPTLAEAMRSVLSADVVARAQLYYTLPSEAALEAQVMAALQHPTERSFTMTSVKLVVPPAPADAGAASARAAQSPTTAPRTRVYSVSVDLDPSALLQLVRLLPYAGTLMRVGEFLERMLMDKEFRDGLTYTPEVIYDLIADAPELAHMIGDGQWNVRTGLALLTAESPALASMAAFYRVMREERRLYGHVPQRAGSDVAERIAAAADLGVFYQALSELQPADLDALLRYGHELQQANPHLAFSREAFASLRAMTPQERRALVTRMAEQAAQLRAIGATPTAPSPDAQGEQLGLTAGGATSAPGGRTLSSSNAAANALLAREPYRSMLPQARPGERPGAVLIGPDTLVQWALHYGDLSVPELRTALIALDAEVRGGNAARRNERAFVLALYLWKTHVPLAESPDGTLAGAYDDDAVRRALQPTEHERAATAHRDAVARDRERRAAEQALEDADVPEIDFEVAQRSNAIAAPALGATSRALFGREQRADSAGFAVSVAIAQQRHRRAVTGVLDADTVVAHLQGEGRTHTPLYARARALQQAAAEARRLAGGGGFGGLGQGFGEGGDDEARLMRLTPEQVRACFEYRPDQPPERRFVPTPRFEQLARELSGSTARRDEKTWHLDYVGFGRALPAPGSNAMLVEVGFRWLSGNPEHPDERREVQTFLYHPEARDTAAALTETSAFLRWGDFVDRIRHRRLEAGEADLHHAPHGGKIRIAATVEGEVDEATDALVFMGVSLSLWSPVPWPFHGPSGVVMLPANEWYGPLPHDVLVPNGSSYDA